MGRIRTIKPSIFTHEKLFDLEIETGFPIRVAWMGLFTVCDREGRFLWRPRSLKTDILPYDNVDFSRVLHALWTRGFICMYRVDGEDYGYIPTWYQHQVINNRESASVFPEPEEVFILQPVDASITRESRVIDAKATRLMHAQVEGNRKGREGNKNKAQAPFILPDWVPFEKWMRFIEMRKRQRKPPTEHAMNLLVAELEKLKALGNPPGEVLDQSILNSWQGVFPLKRNGNSNHINGLSNDPKQIKSAVDKL